MAGGADAVLADFILLGALTGARIEALANLTVGDCQDGIFHIRRDKTAAGARRFPIHSGLTELIARRTAGKSRAAWLFPECSATNTGSRSAAVMKRFRTYRVRLKIDERTEGRRASRITFHSLRKFFITQAVRAGQPEHVVQQVVGHKRQGMTLGVYHGGDTIERLRECVESVRLAAGGA